MSSSSLKSSNRGLLQWWERPGDWVESPNVRRGGESGVKRFDLDGARVYAKLQVGHIYRSLMYPFGRPTVLRECKALTRVAALGVRVPRVVFCAAERRDSWKAVLVTEELSGFQDLDSWYRSEAATRYGDAIQERMLFRLAETLVRLHQGRWQHGCLYGKHVFVRVVGEGESADVEVALLDLEKSRRRLSAARAARRDLSSLRRHSSLSDSDWQRLNYSYQSASGYMS